MNEDQYREAQQTAAAAAREAQLNVHANRLNLRVMTFGVIIAVAALVYGLVTGQSPVIVAGSLLVVVTVIGTAFHYRQQTRIHDPLAAGAIHLIFTLSTACALAVLIWSIADHRPAGIVIGAILTALCLLGWHATTRLRGGIATRPTLTTDESTELRVSRPSPDE